MKLSDLLSLKTLICIIFAAAVVVLVVGLAAPLPELKASATDKTIVPGYSVTGSVLIIVGAVILGLFVTGGIGIFLTRKR